MSLTCLSCKGSRHLCRKVCNHFTRPESLRTSRPTGLSPNPKKRVTTTTHIKQELSENDVSFLLVEGIE